MLTPQENQENTEVVRLWRVRTWGRNANNIAMVDTNSPNAIKDQVVINTDLKQPLPGMQNKLSES